MSSEYFQEIEAHFSLRRGTPFVLSAKDWALMKEWESAGIPLPVIIEAIDAVFAKAGERNKTVNGLRYCRHAVRELWKNRRELQVGEGEAVPEEDAESLLAELAAALASSEYELVRAFAPRVRELARERSVPRIEERMIDLEEELVSALATDELREAASRGAEANARAINANLRRLVREHYAIPRLTLFR